MRAEIIAVGTEMLLGQVVDTNSALIARHLAALGMEVYHHELVGDNPERLGAVIRQARDRSDLIVVSGGLGPTPDDLTKQVAAEVLQVPLATDEKALDQITRHFQVTGQPMTANNRLQALYLNGGVALENHNGLAVGSFYRVEAGADVLLLPGPPSELTPMLEQTAVPLLQQAYQQDEFLESQVLRFFGISESQLVTKLATLIDRQTNPTIAPYAKVNEVTLRVTARATTAAAAQEMVAKTVQQIKAVVGEYLYGYGDEGSLAQVVVAMLVAHHMTITGAESLTAGQFQSTLGDVPGVSAVFPGGFVTYADTAKEQLLGVPVSVVAEHGVVSAETAQEMAERSRQKLNTDVSLSFTGVAGPDSLEGQPAGTVWLGLAQRGKQPQARLFHLSGSRARIRERSVLLGLDWLRRTLQVTK
ncbi:competence damage-inducible protein A [Levilactobacillus senmaizukei DSM 21775 = NBRC 103853]|uniref:Putative competence-damage inducible protein n=1 Tax=Levilactobacillus senmaizukei DSM 21775 = NBRC 103853 TaxID=1423803 RepID=A0A0R2DCY4_9LACO|nr:competence/damage-inducible protein A [Levilactobacillus senmaizukei]KRN01904.1 competence damage-inducible protein A [Levilactobacillus senmaizukei DSM 21775 = NBRC 103853]